MEPPRDNLEQDPLAVLHLDNRLCMSADNSVSLYNKSEKNSKLHLKNTIILYTFLELSQNMAL